MRNVPRVAGPGLESRIDLVPQPELQRGPAVAAAVASVVASLHADVGVSPQPGRARL
jgi:hypothetical protein